MMAKAGAAATDSHSPTLPVVATNNSRMWIVSVVLTSYSFARVSL